MSRRSNGFLGAFFAAVFFAAVFDVLLLIFRTQLERDEDIFLKIHIV